MISRVFMICDAYEAGFGKGQDLRECANPYLETSDCHEAWQIGYTAGTKRRKEYENSKLQKPQSSNQFGSLQTVGNLEEKQRPKRRAKAKAAFERSRSPL